MQMRSRFAPTRVANLKRTQASSCWIHGKDISLAEEALGPANGEDGEDDALLRVWNVVKALLFVYGTIVASSACIPSKAVKDRAASFLFSNKIRRAVDAGMRTRMADDVLTELGLDDYIYELEHVSVATVGCDCCRDSDGRPLLRTGVRHQGRERLLARRSGRA